MGQDGGEAADVAETLGLVFVKQRSDDGGGLYVEPRRKRHGIVSMSHQTSIELLPRVFVRAERRASAA